MADEPDALPDLDQLRQDVSDPPGDSSAELQRRLRESSVESETDYARLAGLKGHYVHKGLWSLFLMTMMGAMIAFQSYLLYKVGIDSWKFDRYPYLLPGLLVQNLAQIAGLCVIVVKSLFTEPTKLP